MRVRELGQPQWLAERRVHVREEGLELIHVRAVLGRDDGVDCGAAAELAEEL